MSLESITEATAISQNLRSRFKILKAEVNESFVSIVQSYLTENDYEYMQIFNGHYSYFINNECVETAGRRTVVKNFIEEFEDFNILKEPLRIYQNHILINF